MQEHNPSYHKKYIIGVDHGFPWFSNILLFFFLSIFSHASKRHYTNYIYLFIFLKVFEILKFFFFNTIAAIGI